MAGWVFSVSFRSSSEPVKLIWETEKPRAASASSNAARAIAEVSANSRPMPEYCDPCPGNKNASRPMMGFRFLRATTRMGGHGDAPFLQTRFQETVSTKAFSRHCFHKDV